MSAKCAGYHIFESRQARYECLKVGVGIKRGAEVASLVFSCLIESLQHKENVILKIDFENAFKSINRRFMPEKTCEIHPEVYKYSHSAYSQPSCLFYCDAEIKFCEGTHKGDPESPVLLSDSIQDLIDSLESKMNLCYLEDENLGDDYRTVLNLKNCETGKTLTLKNKSTNCDFFPC